MIADKLRAAAWALAGLAVVSVVIAMVTPLVVPSLHPNPFVVLAILVATVAFAVLGGSANGHGGHDDPGGPARPAKVDQMASQAVLLAKRRDDRDLLIAMLARGEITQDDFDASLKHLLNAPVQPPPPPRPRA